MLRYSAEASAQGDRYAGGPKPYEQSIIAKMEQFRDEEGYQGAECFVQQCIDAHCGDSADGIKARAYLELILTNSDFTIRKWVRSFNWKQPKPWRK